MRKKFLSLLLALVMAVMVLPMTALAADGNEVVAGTATEVSVSVKVALGTWESTVSFDPSVVETLTLNGVAKNNGDTIGKIEAGLGSKTETYTFEVTFKTAGTHTITVLASKNTIFGNVEEKGETTVVVVEPECQHTVKAEEHAKTAANCKEPGYLMDCWVCECGEWFSAETGEMVTEADCVEAPRADSADIADHDLALAGEGEVAHYECARCEKTFTKEEVDGPVKECQHDGQRVNHDAVAPTCTAKGSRAFWECKGCDKCFEMTDEAGKEPHDASYFALEPVADAHVKGLHVDAVAATCAKPGNVEYWFCDGCGAKLDENGKALTTEQTPVDPTNHGEKSYTSDGKEATCTVPGEIAYWQCGDCKQIFAATDEKGETALTADQLVTPVDPAHHGEKSYVNPGKEATCMEKGNIAYWQCGDCHQFFAETDEKGEKALTAEELEIPVDPTHHGERSYAKPEEVATCVSAGNIAYWQCGDCKQFFAESDEKGETPLTDKELNVPVDPTNHHPDHRQSWDRVEPTCTKEGMEAYWYCQDCQKCFVADDEGVTPVTAEDLVIPVNPTGHTSKIPYAGKTATCVENGFVAYWDCGECGQHFEATDEKGEHPKTIEELWGDTDPKNHPEGMCKLYQGKEYNCVEDGFDSYWQCDACGKFYFADDTAFENPMDDNSQIWHTRLGHDWVAGEEITGVNYEVCSRCGKYRIGGEEGNIIDAIPALHTLDFHQGTPAACTEEGEMDYWYCTDADCGLKFASLEATAPLTDTTIPALGHSCQKVENVLLNGQYPYWVCIRCGQFFADEWGKQPVDAPEDVEKHVLLAHEATAPSCAAGDGNEAYWECKVCGEFYADAEASRTVAENFWVIPFRANNAEHHNLKQIAANDEHIEYYFCNDCGLCFNGTDKNATIIDPSDLGNTTNSGVHTLKYHPEIPATCTTEGTKAYWECLVNHGCSKYFADSSAKKIMTKADMVIPASHTFLYFKGYEPTLDTEGRLGYHYCTTCKMVQLDGSDTLYTMEEARQHWSIEKLPEQSDVQMHKKVAPTCTEDGVKKHWTAKDERTGETLYFLDSGLTNSTTAEALVIPALGHDLKAEGDHYKCSRCGKLFVDDKGEIDYVKPGDTDCKHQAANRSFVAGTEPTCTKTGTADHYRCACGQLFDISGNAVTAQQLSVAALGHDTVYVKATETTVEYWQCQCCGGIFADAAGRVPLNSTVKDNLAGMDHDLDLGGGNWGLSTSGGKHNEP